MKFSAACILAFASSAAAFAPAPSASVSFIVVVRVCSAEIGFCRNENDCYLLMHDICRQLSFVEWLSAILDLFNDFNFNFLSVSHL